MATSLPIWIHLATRSVLWQLGDSRRAQDYYSDYIRFYFPNVHLGCQCAAIL